MSYRLFRRLFFSHDDQTREKMIGQFMNIMHYHARIHPTTHKIPFRLTPSIPKMIRGKSIKVMCYQCMSGLNKEGRLWLLKKRTK